MGLDPCVIGWRGRALNDSASAISLGIGISSTAQPRLSVTWYTEAQPLLISANKVIE